MVNIRVLGWKIHNSTGVMFSLKFYEMGSWSLRFKDHLDTDKLFFFNQRNNVRDTVSFLHSCENTEVLLQDVAQNFSTLKQNFIFF